VLADSVAAFGKWEYPMLKHADDLARYRRAIVTAGVSLVVETGTRTGHSALWFAELGCRVVTIDVANQVSDEVREASDLVTFITGSSTDLWVLDEVRSLVGDARVLVSLDSDHSEEHVRREIALYSPLVSRGCHLVVEDGIIAHLPRDVMLAHGCGIYTGNVMDAIHATLPGRPGWTRDESLESMTGVTMFPEGWWCRI
jgi:cephalosporin hydroxylase